MLDGGGSPRGTNGDTSQSMTRSCFSSLLTLDARSSVYAISLRFLLVSCCSVPERSRRPSHAKSRCDLPLLLPFGSQISRAESTRRDLRIESASFCCEQRL